MHIYIYIYIKELCVQYKYIRVHTNCRKKIYVYIKHSFVINVYMLLLLFKIQTTASLPHLF